jgi:aminoglycoside 3-N-acetyltransferase
MLSYRDLTKAFHSAGLGSNSRVLLHASIPAIGEVAGGAETLLGAIIATVETIITPTFTKKAMIIPPFGPEDNALDYSTTQDLETVGEIFHADLTPDTDLGEIAVTMLRHPESSRSNHPLLSFAGVNADEALATQTLDEPWAPIKWMADADGDVCLLGVDHTWNVALHFAETLAERKQFLRWAMVEGKVVEVPYFPGCSKGFQDIVPHLEGIVRMVPIGDTVVQLFPLRDLINIAAGRIREDPKAYLCDEPECKFCEGIRASHHAITGSK